MFYKVARMICAIFLRILYSIHIHRECEDSDLENGAIICANHSTNLDPVLVAISVKKQIHFMAKKELFESKFMKYLIGNLLGAFPVSRGENDIKSMKTAIRVVKEGNVLGLFPEGTRNVTGEDIEAKAGVGFIVSKTGGKPVVPITIRSGMKLRSRIDITVGKPIDLSAFEDRKLSGDDYREISGIIMDRIRSV